MNDKHFLLAFPCWKWAISKQVLCYDCLNRLTWDFGNIFFTYKIVTCFAKYSFHIIVISLAPHDSHKNRESMQSTCRWRRPVVTPILRWLWSKWKWNYVLVDIFLSCVMLRGWTLWSISYYGRFYLYASRSHKEKRALLSCFSALAEYTSQHNLSIWRTSKILLKCANLMHLLNCLKHLTLKLKLITYLCM